jgi:hypothetical protein
MTPRAYYGLVERLRIERRHLLYCAAVTASATYNIHRKEGTPFIKPEDMIGGTSVGSSNAHSGKQSGEEMLMIIRGVLQPMFNGTENTGVASL